MPSNPLPFKFNQYLGKGPKADQGVGATKLVGRQRQQTANLLESLPYLFEGITNQILPTEKAQLAASQAVSPEYAALQQQLYRQNALGTAQTTADILGGPGQALTRNALALQQIQDPEYFGTRANTAAKLNEILNQPLTGGELSGIERGLNRQFGSQGTLGLPNNSQQLTAGITYGNAGRDRTLQALQTATAALPQLKSGVDTFSQSVKSPSEITGAFGGARETGGTTFPTAAGISGNVNQFANTTLAGTEARSVKRVGAPSPTERVFNALPDYAYSGSAGSGGGGGST